MTQLLHPGDEIWAFTCDWCGRGVKEDDITTTLDGSELCPSCIPNYNADQDAEDGPVTVFISNIDREDLIVHD